MQDFTEDDLPSPVTTEYIDVKVATDVAPNPDELKMRMKGIRTGKSAILG